MSKKPIFLHFYRNYTKTILNMIARKLVKNYESRNKYCVPSQTHKTITEYGLEMQKATKQNGKIACQKIQKQQYCIKK